MRKLTESEVCSLSFGDAEVESFSIQELEKNLTFTVSEAYYESEVDHVLVESESLTFSILNYEHISVLCCYEGFERSWDSDGGFSYDKTNNLKNIYDQDIGLKKCRFDGPSVGEAYWISCEVKGGNIKIRSNDCYYD